MLWWLVWYYLSKGQVVFFFVFFNNKWKPTILRNYCNYQYMWPCGLASCWFGKMWEKIQNLPLCGLQDMSIWIHQNLYSGPVETRHLHLWRPNLHEKVSKIVDTLWIHSLGQVCFMLEKNQIIWNFTTYRKIKYSTKEYIMVQNKELLRS